MCGWIKIHRDIQKHWIAQDMLRFGWWIDMLLLASWEDSRVLIKNQIADLKRGQFVGSLAFFSKRWGVSKDRVSSFLKLLESDGMIKRHLDGHIQQITICNYEDYQDAPDSFPIDALQKVDSLPTDGLPNKEIKEIQELNNNNLNARTREERVSWERDWEMNLLQRFKAQGCGMAVSRATGLKAAEINRLLDVFMAKCELSNLGHRDLEHFNNRFLKAIQSKRLSLPQQEQPAQQKKVTSNEDTYRLMQEMGWQNS